MTREQEYLLICLMEECGEIVQAVSKCLRHGENSYHPDRPYSSNISDLRKEICDLRAVLDLLGEDVPNIKERDEEKSQYAEKQKRLKEFMRDL